MRRMTADEYLKSKECEIMAVTYGDKIRRMTDEELAKMFCNTLTYDEYNDPMFSIWVDRERNMYHSYGDILERLKHPAEE